MRLRTIAEGERIPDGWGVAYWRFSEHRSVILPLGLHWLVSHGRRVWHAFKVRTVPSVLDHAEISGYARGSEHGFEQGRKYERKKMGA